MSDSSGINVFRIPHARMKELIAKHLSHVAELKSFYVSQIGSQTSSDARDSANEDEAMALSTSLENFLQALYEAMWEMKSHEYIENTFIMDRLKRRLHKKKIYNELVCNCHEDSMLLDIISLIEKVYSATDEDASNIWGKQLQDAVDKFLGEFVSHMEEEESVFAPLLVANFASAELRDMESVVLQQHSLFRQKVRSEKSLRDAAAVKRKIDSGPAEGPSDAKRFFDGFDFSLSSIKFSKTYCEEVADRLKHRAIVELSRSAKEDCAVNADTSVVNVAAWSKLPPEIWLMVFAEVDSPRDLLRLASVCRSWHRLTYDKALWSSLLATQWWVGLWSFEYVHPTEIAEAKRSGMYDTSQFGQRHGFYHSAKPPDVGLSSSSSSSPSPASSVENLVIHPLSVVPGPASSYPSYSRNMSPPAAVQITDRATVSGNDGRSSCHDNQGRQSRARTKPVRKRIGTFLATMADHLLPKIRPNVDKFVANCNRFLSDAELQPLLGQCYHIAQLDMSHTAISGACLMASIRANESWGRNLTDINLSGCHWLTDEALTVLADRTRHTVKLLNLSGCANIQQFAVSPLPALVELDVSGVYKISGASLSQTIQTALHMRPERLSYCNDIEDGPWPSEANGCQNFACQTLFCCRSSYARN